MNQTERNEIRERNEKVKAWLWRYRETKKDVRRYEEELRELLESQESTGAIRYSDMPKGSSNQADLSDYMAEREKVWKKVMKAKYKRIKVFQEVENVIEQLPTADERGILSARYIKGKPWENVCVECGYEWAQMHRIHFRALEQIYDMIKDDIE